MATTTCEDDVHLISFQIMIFLSELPWTLFVGIFVLSFLERSLTVFVVSLGSTFMILFLQYVLQQFEWGESQCYIPCIRGMSSLKYAENIRHNKYGPDIATALIIYQVTLNVFCFTVFTEGRQKLRGITSTFVCIACSVSRVFLGLASADSAITGAMAGAFTAVAWSSLLRKLNNIEPTPWLFMCFISLSTKEFEEEIKTNTNCLWWCLCRFRLRFGFDNDLKLKCKEEEIMQTPSLQSQEKRTIKYVF